jgi:lysophospholipase L1-like esterase
LAARLRRLRHLLGKALETGLSAVNRVVFERSPAPTPRPVDGLLHKAVLPTRILGIPASAATVLLLTLLLTQALPLLGGPGSGTLSYAQWFSVVDLIGGRELRFDTGTGDPMEPLTALLAREQRFPLMDPHNSLDGFFAALQRAEAGELRGKIHILHYGDSPTTADLITADVRARMQDRFGNAGHGFSLVAPPWAWYQHRGIRLRASGWRMVSPAMGMKGDGKYGLGGVSFEGTPGAYSQITLQDRTHTHLKVYFLDQPEGGVVEILADGALLAETDTAADTVRSTVRTYPIPSGTKDVLLRVVSGSARVFGMEFSRNAPGVVYSSLGLNGANTTTLSRYMEAGHWGQQLRAAEPQLVIINYGTNESVYGSFVTKYLETELRRLITLVRESVPNSAILIMSPMDRGTRSDSGEIVTPETIPDIVRIQEKVASDMKVAFFNTFEAMGGSGTMAKWFKRNPRLVGGDYIHPMPAGAKLVGDLLYEGLEEQYQRYKLKKIQKSLRPGKSKAAALPADRRKKV